ncbi:MAG TPA: hypothetical protein VGM32_07860, partial [Rhodopila sp.]
LAESDVEIEAYAQNHPFSHDAAEVPDISRTAERHYADPRTSAGPVGSPLHRRKGRTSDDGDPP